MLLLLFPTAKENCWCKTWLFFEFLKALVEKYNLEIVAQSGSNILWVFWALEPSSDYSDYYMLCRRVYVLFCLVFFHTHSWVYFMETENNTIIVLTAIKANEVISLESENSTWRVFGRWVKRSNMQAFCVDAPLTKHKNFLIYFWL